MNKQVFNEIYERLGSIPRTRMKVIKHTGSGTNEGLEVFIAALKDLPSDGLTTLFSVSLSSSDVAARKANDIEPPLETVEYICAVPNDLADEFAQTDFQYYLMASLKNNWPNHVGFTDRLSNSPFKTDTHLLAEPVAWPELPLQLEIQSVSVRLVWFFPLLSEESLSIGKYNSDQLRDLLKRNGLKTFDLNRQENLA